MTSKSREGDAFMCSTLIPSRTGSVHARTPGAPSTCTRQFGHWPAQHRRPRRRWYLKLRENVRWPAAYSAEPIVSPSSASTGFPSKVKPRLCSRSTRSPGCGDRRLTWSPPRGIRPRVLRRSFGLRPLVTGSASRNLREQHVVRPCVALGEEPGSAAGAVEPPLPLHTGDVAPEVVVGAQLALTWTGRRAGLHLAAEAEVRDLAGAAVGTGEDVGHGRSGPRLLHGNTNRF